MTEEVKKLLYERLRYIIEDTLDDVLKADKDDWYELGVKDGKREGRAEAESKNEPPSKSSLQQAISARYNYLSLGGRWGIQSIEGMTLEEIYLAGFRDAAAEAEVPL